MSDIISVDYLQYFKSDSVFKSSHSQMRTALAYELEFYKTSNGYSVIDGEKYKHKIGNILIAKPQSQRYSVNYFECYGIHFTCNDETFAKKYLDTLPTVLNLPGCEYLFHDAVFSRMTNPLAQKLSAAAAVLKIVSSMHEAFNVSGEKNISLKNISRINAIAEYIKTHFHENIDIDALREQQFMSRSLFFSLYKSVTGLTPADYINTVRIDHAKILLNTSDMPISEIAQNCGFCSQAYFNYVFKEKTGQTPMKYRNRKMYE